MKMKQIDSLVWRGSHPITDDDFKQLKAAGIKYIINLESGIWERWKGDINYEVEMCIKHDIDVCQFHMGFIFPPQVHELDYVLCLIESQKAKGNAVADIGKLNNGEW